MIDDTMTIELNGNVSLKEFSDIMIGFQALIDSLSKEVGDEAIEWIIDDLSAGSAMATVRGFSGDPNSVDRVVKAYQVIGKALEQNENIPYSAEIDKHSRSIVSKIGNNITSIRFGTSETDSLVTAACADDYKLKPKMVYSYGIIKGVVETLTKRRGLKFTLYDSFFDRAVSCHLREDQENKMRDAWGRKVSVSGVIGRQPQTGYPVVVKDIREIKIIQDVPDYEDYKKARAILFSDEKSEDIIRRLRDA